MGTGAEAKNLEAIQKAIVKHNGNCDGAIIAIRMNPFEIERLGWDDFRGIPLEPSERLGTGRFELVCDQETDDAPQEIVEERELVPVGAPTPAPDEKAPWGVPTEFDTEPAFDPYVS